VRADVCKFFCVDFLVTFCMVSVDVLQLSLSHNGHQYAFVFMDCFTMWPEVLAAEDQPAETITWLLAEHVISHHGVPEYLSSF